MVFQIFFTHGMSSKDIILCHVSYYLMCCWLNGYILDFYAVDSGSFPSLNTWLVQIPE